MSRLSGNIRITKKETQSLVPSNNNARNYFGFNKGCIFDKQSVSGRYTVDVIQRPDVHGFDIRVLNSDIIFSNYVARVGNLNLPKNGKYFVSFDIWCSENYHQASYHVDLCDKQTSPFQSVSFGSDGSQKKHYAGFVDVTNYNLAGGFIDFNMGLSSYVKVNAVYHIENLMITDSDTEVSFTRPIEDVVANALNGLSTPTVMIRRSMAKANTQYYNGKEVVENGIAYLDIVVPYNDNYTTESLRNAPMYMCVANTSYTSNPTQSMLAGSSNWKRMNKQDVSFVETLVANTVDANTVGAQRIILKSGNTINGCITGVPASTAGSDFTSGSGYYAWFGSANAKDAPVSIDVNGNMKIGGAASFNRRVKEITANYTIRTSEQFSIFNVFSKKELEYITINIENGDYENKEIEIINGTKLNASKNNGRVDVTGGIKFIIGGEIADVIHLRDVGTIVKLRHIRTNAYNGVPTNYFIVTNASDFVYNGAGEILTKPITLPGTRYEINVSISDKEFWYSLLNGQNLNGTDHTIVAISDSDEINDGIFKDTDLPKVFGGVSYKELVQNVRTKITITKYVEGEHKHVFQPSVADKLSDNLNSPILYVSAASGGSGNRSALLAINLSMFYYMSGDPFNGGFSQPNEVYLQFNTDTSQNPDTFIHKLHYLGNPSGKEYIGHYLIILLGDIFPYRDNAHYDDYPMVNFSGTLFVNK